MKNYNYKVILLIFLLGIIAIITFNYISFLKEQNHVYADNTNNSIRQIRVKLAALESKDVMEELIALRQENTTLKKQIDDLKLKLNQVSQAKENLQAQLSYFSEPEKTVRELKTQMRKVTAEIKKKTKPERLIEGNRGFLIKDGKSTYP